MKQAIKTGITAFAVGGDFLLKRNHQQIFFFSFTQATVVRSHLQLDSAMAEA
jgi:hypothetical protein